MVVVESLNHHTLLQVGEEAFENIGVGYFVGNNDRLIQLRSGRIIYPVAFTNQVNSGGIDFIYYSDDNGNTWQSSSWILPPADKQNDGSCGLQEPGTVELPENNHLMCW